mmetsp:Transcript_21498/g.36005  ORF Transcript_21498/g.36005 Transcript_21498/m.36005 type:complete len:285 (+) Transcript_21498:82-936(+)
MFILALLLLIRYSSVPVRGETYPTCGDCFCVPALNGSAPCPKLWQPKTEFSAAMIAAYKQQVPLIPYTLNCNPYEDSDCSTSPPQEYLDLDGAVCGFIYSQEADEVISCTSYTMKSYPSRTDAINAGAVITHEGSCGVCSTAQDQALFLTEDFTDAGKKCATKGVVDEEAGLQCYIELGMSTDCAKIWNYDGIYDGQVCTKTCLGKLQEPNNGPPPACTLNECLQCDEDEAGPIFSAFSGRTRRRSGLLSEIVRPCESIARINIYDPCTNPSCGCSTGDSIEYR